MKVRILILVLMCWVLYGQTPVTVQDSTTLVKATVTATGAVKTDSSATTQPVSGTVTTTPPANASTNVAQVGGTNTDTNSGNKSGGTIRVVLATDQPQLTNSLKVDGSGVTQPVSATFNSTPQSTSTYAALAFDLAATAATQVKASSGNVWGWYGYNPNTVVCYLQFYNSASASLGTNALHAFGVPSGASFNVAPGAIAFFNLSTAISTGQTTTATGATPCSSAMVVTILYD